MEGGRGFFLLQNYANKCLYLDRGQNPVTPDASSGGFHGLIRHVGCIRGAWPQVSVKPETVIRLLR